MLLEVSEFTLDTIITALELVYDRNMALRAECGAGILQKMQAQCLGDLADDCSEAIQALLKAMPETEAA